VAAPIATHLLPDTANISQWGRLFVGGLDVAGMAEEYGTPLFVYDEFHLRKRCQEAVSSFGTGVAYASKAFLCAAMAKLAYEEGMHIDVASAGEAYVALRAGVPAEWLVFHGNNKSTAELTYALEQKFGRIVVDSFDELERLQRLANFGHQKPKVLLRLTPGVEAHAHEYISTGQEDSKFGFSIKSGAAMEAVVKCRASTSGVELVGVHAHVGSSVTVIESFEKVVATMAAFFVPLGLPELVIGGGLAAPYMNHDEKVSIRDWAAAVQSAAVSAGVSNSVVLSAEPGRAIVANAGMTLYRVGTIKELPDVRTYLSVDGGMSDNIRPALYGAEYEAFLPRRADAERDRLVRIVGKHCESGDIISREAWVPDDTAVGDVLCTPVTGAYGHVMASNYNKLPRPAVIFVNDGRTQLVVRRESYEDLLRNDVF
jgi:diaminopimelate decarboxylase